MQYAQSNAYHPLVDSSLVLAANTAWLERGGCRDQVCRPFHEWDCTCLKRHRLSRVITEETTRFAQPPWTSATRSSSGRSQEIGMYITCPQRILTHTRPRSILILTAQQ